jgi:hypothetical protein
MRLESFMSSHIRLFRYDEFMLLCQAFFVGLILCGGEIFHRHHGDDTVIRWPALLGGHPWPKYVHRSRLSIFLDGRLKALSKTIIGNVRAGEGVTTLLLQCNLFTEVFGVFLRAEIDAVKKVFSRDFIVILSHRSYFVFPWMLGPNQWTCNWYE